MRGLACLSLVLLGCSCAVRRPPLPFRVLPRSPEYLLRAPDSAETPFPEILTGYNGFIPGSGWVNLRPWLELRIENAYYREGAPKHGLDGFLGTEIARYQVRAGGGLRLISVRSELKRRPPDQPPVENLIRGRQKTYPFHRFFYAIVFRRKGGSRGSVLLGARSAGELDRLATRLLSDPDSVCNGADSCTAFPEACSVALEMEIVVNGSLRTVLWGSPLSSVVTSPQRLALRRLYLGRLEPVELDAADPKALRLPLLPGDHIDW